MHESDLPTPDDGEGDLVAKKAADDDVRLANDDVGAAESTPDDTEEQSAEPSKRQTLPRHATLFSLAVAVALTVLAGWFGFHIYQAQLSQNHRNQFLQVARQGALNLTTIDWEHVDADVRRILDGATGEFHDDFVKRSQPFIEAVRQSKAVTVGTVVEAGLVSDTADTAQTLVAVSVKTTNSAAPDQVERSWRLRIDVQRVGDQLKVSNVEFVL